VGRDQLFAGEMQRMVVADNIIKAYHSRASYPRTDQGSEQWAKWALENKRLAVILADAEKAAGNEQ
jgi:hypothetical protein